LWARGCTTDETKRLFPAAARDDVLGEHPALPIMSHRIINGNNFGDRKRKELGIVPPIKEIERGKATTPMILLHDIISTASTSTRNSFITPG